MAESVEYLDRVGDAATPAAKSRRNVLRLYAGYFTSDGRPATMASIARQLLAEAHLAIDRNTQLRALWCAACQLTGRPALSLIDEIWQSLASISPSELSLEDKGEHALGKAFCLYNSGYPEKSLAVINEVILELEERGMTNSVYVALQVGLGASYASSGDYERGRRCSEKAYKAAMKVGNDRRACQSAGNLALCYYRLGDIEKQLVWARAVSTLAQGGADVVPELRSLFLQAHSHLMRGDNDHAITIIEAGDRLMRSELELPTVQMWNLYAADCYLLAGLQRKAMEAGRAATTGACSELLSASHAGRYARWLAILGAEGDFYQGGIATRLGQLCEQREALDKVDKVEVLLAVLWNQWRSDGLADRKSMDLLFAELRNLPSAVTNELSMLGMLELRPHMARPCSSSPGLPERLGAPGTSAPAARVGKRHRRRHR